MSARPVFIGSGNCDVSLDSASAATLTSRIDYCNVLLAGASIEG